MMMILKNVLINMSSRYGHIAFVFCTRMRPSCPGCPRTGLIFSYNESSRNVCHYLPTPSLPLRVDCRKSKVSFKPNYDFNILIIIMVKYPVWYSGQVRVFEFSYFPNSRGCKFKTDPLFRS